MSCVMCRVANRFLIKSIGIESLHCSNDKNMFRHMTWIVDECGPLQPNVILKTQRLVLTKNMQSCWVSWILPQYPILHRREYELSHTKEWCSWQTRGWVLHAWLSWIFPLKENNVSVFWYNIRNTMIMLAFTFPPLIYDTLLFVKLPHSLALFHENWLELFSKVGY